MSVSEHPLMPYRTSVMINGKQYQSYHNNFASADRDNIKFLNLRPLAEYIFSNRSKSGLKRISVHPYTNSIGVEYILRGKQTGKFYLHMCTNEFTIEEICDKMWELTMKQVPDGLHYKPSEVLETQSRFYVELAELINEWIV